MNRTRLLLLFALTLPAQSRGQESEECLGYDLKDPGQTIAMLAPTHTWTLYNLGPGQVVIHDSGGGTHPGPAPSSEPQPITFLGETGTSYTLSLDGPGLTIIYICPGT